LRSVRPGNWTSLFLQSPLKFTAHEGCIFLILYFRVTCQDETDERTDGRTVRRTKRRLVVRGWQVVITWSVKRTAECRSDRAWDWCVDLSRLQSSSGKHLSSRDRVPGDRPSWARCSRACPAVAWLLAKNDSSVRRRLRQLKTDHRVRQHDITSRTELTFITTWRSETEQQHTTQHQA